MTIDPTQWPTTGAIVAAGRSILIYPRELHSDLEQSACCSHCLAHCFACAENNATGVTLNFGGLAGAIKVRNGGFLAFLNLGLAGPAHREWTSSNDTYLVDAAFASLPSIETEPNATVSSKSQLTSNLFSVGQPALQHADSHHTHDSDLNVDMHGLCRLCLVARHSSSTLRMMLITVQPSPQG